MYVVVDKDTNAVLVYRNRYNAIQFLYDASIHCGAHLYVPRTSGGIRNFVFIGHLAEGVDAQLKLLNGLSDREINEVFGDLFYFTAAEYTDERD